MPLDDEQNTVADDGPGTVVRNVQPHDTRWSQVLLAGQTDDESGQRAMAELCQNYWYPVYAYIRSTGQSPENASDLCQGFFQRLLEEEWVGAADPARGRFRDFIRVILKRFLASEWARSQAQKRGGGRTVNWDSLSAEQRYDAEPRDSRSPDVLHDRRWALWVIERAQKRLRAEMIQQGYGDRYDRLQATLVGDRTTDTYADLAAGLGLEVTGVKALVHRMRARFRALLREEVAETVFRREDIDVELRSMLQCLSVSA